MGDTGVEAVSPSESERILAHSADRRASNTGSCGPGNTGECTSETQTVPHGTDVVAVLRRILRRTLDEEERETLAALIRMLEG